MPVIKLEGHSYKFPVSDVLRLFYGEAENIDSGEISAGSDLHIVIHSRVADGIVSTRMEGKSEWDCIADADMAISPKREVKRQLYKILSRLLGHEFPWGSLTGIRPTLVAREVGNAEQLTERYFVRPDKARLAVKTAAMEDHTLLSSPAASVSVYVGVPFCRSRCTYCSFISQDASSQMYLLKDYADAVQTEIDEYFRENSPSISSLYFGGGTPTVFDDLPFQQFMDGVFRSLHADEIPEITVEAGRADTITENKLKTLKNLGVTRICINPQTLSDQTLALLGRRHTVEEFYEAYNLAVRLGFTTINTDLIAGLPQEKEQDFEHSLEGVLSLHPQNITIHTLSKKRNAALAPEILPWTTKDEMTVPDAMISYAHKRLQDVGYEPYYLYRQKNTVGGHENTGYTLPGHACTYNVAMMSDRRSVIGFGAGSISKRLVEGTRLERCPNIRNPKEYIERAAEMAMRKKELFRV